MASDPTRRLIAKEYGHCPKEIWLRSGQQANGKRYKLVRTRRLPHNLERAKKEYKSSLQKDPTRITVINGCREKLRFGC